MKIKNTNKYIKFITSILLIIYLIILFNRVLFYAYGSYYRSSSSISYNLLPFKTIMNYLKSYNSLNFNVWFFNLFGNIIAFIPFGFLLPFAYKKINKYKNSILSGLILSSIIETLQIITRLGSFDVDDIILNTTGVYLGFIVYKVVLKFLKY